MFYKNVGQEKEVVMKRALAVVVGGMLAVIGGLLCFTLSIDTSKGEGPNLLPFAGLMLGMITKAVGEDKQPKSRKTRRMTLYIRKDHYEALEEISKATGIPLSTLIGLALDLYLLEKLGILKEPEIPPISDEYIKRKIQTVTP